MPLASVISKLKSISSLKGKDVSTHLPTGFGKSLTLLYGSLIRLVEVFTWWMVIAKWFTLSPDLAFPNSKVIFWVTHL